jgi:dipeptidyl aminopeptidase/acylaminoacyl peptidase
MRTVRGRSQGWILDRFVASGGLETLFREALPYFLEMGYKYVDLMHAAASAKSAGLLLKGLCRVGEERLAAAAVAEEHGHRVTARDEYHRASKCFSRAQWMIFDDTPLKRELHAKCLFAYDKVVALNPYPTEKVEIACDGGTLFAVLHLPPGADRVPCVVFCPGLDMVKEDYPNVERNSFLERGMAVISFDGPGHGETRLNGRLRWRVGADGDNYAAAATALVDYLATRPEIDSSRVGVFGISQGSYWGPIMAAAEPRLRACACMMGSFYEQGFDLGQPTFKENFMYMTGSESEAEAEALIPFVTLDGIETEIRCPLLVLHGEMDELTPEEEARRFVDRAVNADPREIVIFENEFHPLGGVSPEAFNHVADWLHDNLSAATPPLDGRTTVPREGRLGGVAGV